LGRFTEASATDRPRKTVDSVEMCSHEGRSAMRGRISRSRRLEEGTSSIMLFLARTLHVVRYSCSRWQQWLTSIDHSLLRHLAGVFQPGADGAALAAIYRACQLKVQSL
jgi:hypothetical protein